MLAAMVVLGPLLTLVGDGAGTAVDAFLMATSMTFGTAAWMTWRMAMAMLRRREEYSARMTSGGGAVRWRRAGVANLRPSHGRGDGRTDEERHHAHKERDHDWHIRDRDDAPT